MATLLLAAPPLGSLSLLALVLATLGVYGPGFSVPERAREIGLRMALGAERGKVRTLFLNRGPVSLDGTS